MKQIVGGKLYDTETAKLIASNRYWDGRNFERHGRNTFLYKTQRGNFFLYHTTCWQGERDYIEPVTLQRAKEVFEQLPVIEVEYEEAFGMAPEEA